MEKKTKIHNKFIEKRFSGNELKYLKEIINFGFKFRESHLSKCYKINGLKNLKENIL